MSIFVALAFLSAMSAMTMVGPRVYAAMAEDGFLPRALAARSGRPPFVSTLFQSAVSLAIVWTHSLRHALDSVGALLVLFSALTCCSLFAMRFRRDLPNPRPIALVCAVAYVCLSAWVLVYGVKNRISPSSPHRRRLRPRRRDPRLPRHRAPAPPGSRVIPYRTGITFPFVTRSMWRYCPRR